MGNSRVLLAALLLAVVLLIVVACRKNALPFGGEGFATVAHGVASCGGCAATSCAGCGQ